MRFVEETGGSWTAEQLRAAEAEIEQQKREWEANRLAALKKEEEDGKRAAEEDEMLTYAREDAQNQVNNNKFNKRKSLNRRLLNVRQNDRNDFHTNSSNRLANKGKKMIPGRASRVTKQSIALGTRRTLRNNTNAKLATESNKPEAMLASRSNRSVLEPRHLVKRKVSARVSSRLSRLIQSNSENVSTDDDEALSTFNTKNNGVDNDAKGSRVTAKAQNVATNEQNDSVNEQQNSEDFDDSECSLDVMVDSTDPQDSDDDSNDIDSEQSVQSGTNDDDDNDVEEDEEDEDGEEDEEEQSEDEQSEDEREFSNKSKSFNTTFRSQSNSMQENIEMDADSPRTRSHGRVKINLWALDESQKVPELCAKRSLNKVNASRGSIKENGGDCSADDDEITSADDGDDAVHESKTRYRHSANTSTSTIDNFRKRKLSGRFEKQPNKRLNSSASNKNNANNDLRAVKCTLPKNECGILAPKTRLKS